MYTADVERMVELSEKNAAYLERNSLGYLILAILAGIYLGFGICLIFSLGASFWAEGSSAFKLVMGVSFCIALTLVVFAGSEVFTGNNMVCALGALAHAITIPEISWMGFLWNQLWVVSGNVVGGMVFMGGAYWIVSPAGVGARMRKAIPSPMPEALRVSPRGSEPLQ